MSTLSLPKRGHPKDRTNLNKSTAYRVSMACHVNGAGGVAIRTAAADAHPTSPRVICANYPGRCSIASISRSNYPRCSGGIVGEKCLDWRNQRDRCTAGRRRTRPATRTAGKDEPRAGRTRSGCGLPARCHWEALLREAGERFGWSARAYYRVLKVARTIADLAAADSPTATHLAEAIQYRRAFATA